jgi:hypothetical protein
MLIIGGIVMSFAVFNGVYPAVERSSQAISAAADTVNDRLMSRIEIIQVGNAGTTVDAWVKNVGSARIGTAEMSDIFFGIEGNITRVPYGNESSPLPYWSYQIEGGNLQWGQAITNRITIHLASSPSPGTYLLKIIIPNGIFDETTFGIH